MFVSANVFLSKTRKKQFQQATRLRCSQPTATLKLTKYKMKELKSKLLDLQKRGFEQVTIVQITQWIAEIEREKRLKRFERQGKV